MVNGNFMDIFWGTLLQVNEINMVGASAILQRRMKIEIIKNLSHFL